MVADIYRASELCQIDYNGEIVAHDKQTRFCALLPVTCSGANQDIDVGITLHIELPIAKVASIPKDQGQRLHTVAYHAGLQVKDMLGRRGIWDLYNAERITLYGEDPLSLSDSLEMKCDVEITEALANHFRDATKRHAEAEQALEKAKEYLDSGLDYACNDSSRISSAARFIADCMRADGTPMMGAWNDEKSAVLLAHIKDLVKRKNPNHPNYQSMASWVRSTLYSVRCPTYWAKYPPQPHLLDLR